MRKEFKKSISVFYSVLWAGLVSSLAIFFFLVSNAHALTVSPSSFSVDPNSSISFTATESFSKSSYGGDPAGCPRGGSRIDSVDYFAAWNANASWGWQEANGDGVDVGFAGFGGSTMTPSDYVYTNDLEPGTYSWTWTTTAPSTPGSYTITVTSADYRQEEGEDETFNPCDTPYSDYDISTLNTKTVTVTVNADPGPEPTRTLKLLQRSASPFSIPWAWSADTGTHDSYQFKDAAGRSIAQLSANTTTYTEGGLSPNRLITTIFGSGKERQAISLNLNAVVARSNKFNGLTGPPAPRWNSSACPNHTNTSIDISWRIGSNDGGDASVTYQAYYRSGGSWVSGGSSQSPGNPSRISGLNKATNYNIYIPASNLNTTYSRKGGNSQSTTVLCTTNRPPSL